MRVWKEHFNNLLDKEQVVSGAIPLSHTVFSGLEDPVSAVLFFRAFRGGNIPLPNNNKFKWPARCISHFLSPQNQFFPLNYISRKIPEYLPLRLSQLLSILAIKKLLGLMISKPLSVRILTASTSQVSFFNRCLSSGLILSAWLKSII